MRADAEREKVAHQKWPGKPLPGTNFPLTPTRASARTQTRHPKRTAEGHCADTHIVPSWIVLRPCLDSVSQEAENGADPQEDGETPKQLAAKLHPFRSGGRWGQGIGTIPG